MGMQGRTDSFAFSFPDGNENKGVAAVESGGKQQSTGLARDLSRIFFTFYSKCHPKAGGT